MPSLKETRLQHIQDVLSGKKKVLRQKEVPARKMPNWPQLAVKIIYPQAIEKHPDLLEYLPVPSLPLSQPWYVLLHGFPQIGERKR